MRHIWIVFVAGAVAFGMQNPSIPKPVAQFTASTEGLKAGPASVRIDLLSWSSDAVRSQLVDAWNMLPPAASAAGPRGAAGGRGPAGARGRGAGPAPEPAPAAPARGGARGGARGAAPAAPGANDAAATPEGSLAAALQSIEGVGYIWTSESIGYSIRYAYRLMQPDGSERIILATDRRLGAADNHWKPAAGGAVPEYSFSVIELRIDAKRPGEGKSSLQGKVGLDSTANTIALADYAGGPLLLKEVVKVSR